MVTRSQSRRMRSRSWYRVADVVAKGNDVRTSLTQSYFTIAKTQTTHSSLSKKYSIYRDKGRSEMFVMLGARAKSACTAITKRASSSKAWQRQPTSTWYWVQSKRSMGGFGTKLKTTTAVSGACAHGQYQRPHQTWRHTISPQVVAELISTNSLLWRHRPNPDLFYWGCNAVGGSHRRTDCGRSTSSIVCRHLGSVLVARTSSLFETTSCQSFCAGVSRWGTEVQVEDYGPNEYLGIISPATALLTCPSLS